MSSLTIRRLIVWVVSLVLGFVVAALIIVVGFPIIKPEAAGLTLKTYGTIYYLSTAGPIALIFVVWLDYFMDTHILND